MQNQNQTQNNSKAKPDLVVRMKDPNGSNLTTIGVAWTRDDGSLYIKLYGKQLIDTGFYVFPNTKD